MPLSWTDGNQRKLLLLIIDEHVTGTLNYAKLAAGMGPGATVEAVKCQMKKLRKLAKEMTGDTSNDEPGASASSAPRSRSSKTTTLPTKRKKTAMNWEDQDDDEEIEDVERKVRNDTPVKKIKREIKDENEDDLEI